MMGKPLLLTGMRNKLGGLVFTGNRFGSNIVRTWAKPVDPNTNELETIRSLFSGAVTAFQDLPTASQSAYNQYASQTVWKNALGDDVFLTGMNWYVAIRTGYLTLDPTALVSEFTAPPATPGLMPMPLVAFTYPVNPIIGVVVSIQNQSLLIDADYTVDISPPQNTSKIYYKGPYVTSLKQTVMDLAAGDNDDAEFSPLESSRYFFRVRGFESTAPHRMSEEVFGYADADTLPI